MSGNSDATLQRFTDSLAKTVTAEVERRMREILHEAVSLRLGEFYTDANGLQQWRWLARKPGAPTFREPCDDDFKTNSLWVAKDDPGYRIAVIEATANFVECEARNGRWRIPRQTFVEKFRPCDDPPYHIWYPFPIPVPTVGNTESFSVKCDPQPAF